MDPVTEIEIWSRLVDPQDPNLDPDSARGLLKVQFKDRDRARVAELAERANEGTLTEAERGEYETYVYVADVLGLLQAKARAALQRNAAPAA
ncbi:MAG TPA: hypothetical protein VK324_03995 [Tepidisphaeraceae bacterium]|nr:hypothetical protein [Tepidisphaeraceae bacterium]